MAKREKYYTIHYQVPLDVIIDWAEHRQHGGHRMTRAEAVEFMQDYEEDFIAEFEEVFRSRLIAEWIDEWFRRRK
jgi:hypothetical protein